MRQGNHRRWPQVAAGHGDLSGRVQLQPGKYKHVTDCVLIGFLKGGAIANHRLENYIEVIEQFP